MDITKKDAADCYVGPRLWPEPIAFPGPPELELPPNPCPTSPGLGPTATPLPFKTPPPPVGPRGGGSGVRAMPGSTSWSFGAGKTNGDGRRGRVWISRRRVPRTAMTMVGPRLGPEPINQVRGQAGSRPFSFTAALRLLYGCFTAALQLLCSMTGSHAKLRRSMPTAGPGEGRGCALHRRRRTPYSCVGREGPASREGGASEVGRRPAGVCGEPVNRVRGGGGVKCLGIESLLLV